MDFWRFHEDELTTAVEVSGVLDPALGFLSACIAIVGAIGMFRAVQRLRAADSRLLHHSWLAAAAFGMGFGIWGMHFTAMVAYILPFPVEYDFWITAGSLLPALLGSCFAAYLLGKDNPSHLQLNTIALLLALGIGSMHYIGMEAMLIPGEMTYDGIAFTMSILLAFIIALVSLYVAHNLLRAKNKIFNSLAIPIGGGLLGSAVTSMHHFAMAAAHFHVVPSQISGAGELPAPLIAGIVAVISILIGMIWLGSLVDYRLETVTASLKESELRNRSIIDSMLDGQVVIDAGGLIQSLNPAARRIFGFGSAEIMGKNINMLMPEPFSHFHDGYIKRYLADRQSHVLNKKRQSKLMGLRKNGEIFPIELMVTRFDMKGKEYFSGIIRDVTEQRKTEDHSRLMSVAVEHAADAIVIFNADRAIDYVNPRFNQQLGYAASEVLGYQPWKLDLERSDEKLYKEMWRKVQRGEVWSGQHRTPRSDGNILEEDITLSPVKDKGGNLTHYVQIRRDVTERMQLESQLQQAQKLESIGQLAAGIAHEINTPSQYVGDNTRFLKEAFDDFNGLASNINQLIDSTAGPIQAAELEQLLEEADVSYLKEETPRAINQSLDGIERITKIVRAMKEFSHPGQQKVPVDLNRAIESTITVATNEWKYVADLDIQLDPELPQVPCHAGEIKQVILNIIINASHAIADVIEGESKGRISIKTVLVDGWAEIHIADTGGGMVDDVRAHIFDPFFTTKEVGKGTGQGLSIAYAIIVEKHEGTIAVDSEPGHGACFVIRLPLSLDSEIAA